MGGTAYPVPVPPTMKLFTGADGNVVYNSNSVGPMSIIGATSVQLTLGNSTSITGYTGPPQIFVEQDPAHPQPIDLRVDRHPATGASPTLNLTNAGNGLMSLTSDSGTIWWRVFYAGANTQLTINYGSAPVIVSDTGAAGTEISPDTGTIDVYGTTGPLTINPSGTHVHQDRTARPIEQHAGDSRRGGDSLQRRRPARIHDPHAEQLRGLDAPRHSPGDRC